MTILDLKPNDNRKSFYGKAKIIMQNDGNKIILQSYNTYVGYIINGIFYRTWHGYSVTTMRHVNAFLAAFGVPGGGKAWWDNLPVEDI